MRQGGFQNALLVAAIDIVQNGRDRLARHKDPAGDGPFQLRTLPGGFELQSKLVRGEEPVTLQVGPGERQE